MSQPEKERRHAVLVVLYVLGTLLLFLLTQRRESREPLRFGETREGELRDALASAAAPDLGTEPGEGLEAAGFEDDALGRDLSRDSRAPRWSAEGEDGFRLLDSGVPREPDWLAGRCR